MTFPCGCELDELRKMENEIFDRKSFICFDIRGESIDDFCVVFRVPYMGEFPAVIHMQHNAFIQMEKWFWEQSEQIAKNRDVFVSDPFGGDVTIEWRRSGYFVMVCGDQIIEFEQDFRDALRSFAGKIPEIIAERRQKKKLGGVRRNTI